MSVPGAPRTLTQMAHMEVDVRSDYQKWCDGWRNICGQLSGLAVTLEDELYVRLAAGGDYDAKARARKAVRPLRGMAVAADLLGRLGPRAFKVYRRYYATEIPKPKARPKFDHTR